MWIVYPVVERKSLEASDEVISPLLTVEQTDRQLSGSGAVAGQLEG